MMMERIIGSDVLAQANNKGAKWKDNTNQRILKRADKEK